MDEVLVPVPYRVIDTNLISYATTGVAPHADTERARYTVSTNTYGKIQHIYIRVRRASAAGTAGIVQARVEHLHDGTTVDWLLNIWLTTNGVGDTQWGSLAEDVWMVPGDAVRIVTSDSSTGGTVDYYIYVDYMTVR